MYLASKCPILLRISAVILCVLLLGSQQTIYAEVVPEMSAEERASIQRGTTFYDSTDAECSVEAISAVGSPDNPAGSSGVWNSGLQPDYILEQFAIETLKNLAKKNNVDPSQTVTEEHVIALLAFMYGEGGDINNRFLFNPLNTGINDPELVDGSTNASGLQSFKSFDAGVEGTARTMVKKTQSRLNDVLIKRDSTAYEFMQALTYFQRYPGNKLWAEASLPPYQNSYYKERIQLVRHVRTHYTDIASLIIGTDEREAAAGKRDKSKLQFNPASNNSNSDIELATATGGDACITGSSGVVSGNIVQTALGLAWQDKKDSRGKNRSDARPSYQAAMPRHNGSVGYDPYSDCGVFVATVMHASGADKDYPKRGTGIQIDYLRNSPKYDVFEGIKSTGSLQPGDILIFSGSPYGHTYIYTGTFKGTDGNSYNMVEASLGNHVPEADNAYFEWRGNQFTVARLKS